MQPALEYFKRHLINIPLVKQIPSHGYLLARDESEKVSWTLFYIRREGNLDSPVSYSIRSGPPFHNVYTAINEGQSVFCGHYQVADFYKKIRLTEYEDFFYEWPTHHGFKPLFGDKEITLAAWEAFVYAYDAHLVKQACYKTFSEMFHQILDYSQPIDVRHRNYVHFSKMIDMRAEPFKTWSNNVNDLLTNYCTWAEGLV